MKKFSKKECDWIREYIELRPKITKAIKRITNAEGICIESGEIIKDCFIFNNQLYKKTKTNPKYWLGEKCDNYFVNQWERYPDFYEGYIYFPTEIKGQYFCWAYEC